MQTYEAIIKGRSVREYLPKEIPQEILIKLIDAARLAATARNEQPWEFVVVTDKQKKAKIAGISAPNGAFMAEAGAVIAVFCLDSKYYLEDGSAATENILIMAADLGLGSCWVAGDKKPYCKEILEFLGVSEKYKLVSLISLGYPKNYPKVISKRKVEEVLHWQAF